MQPDLFHCWNYVSIAETVENALSAEDCTESAAVPEESIAVVEDNSDEDLFCEDDFFDDGLAPAAKKPRIS